MVFGGLIMAAWGGFKNRIYTMVFSGFALGICTFAMGVIPIFWLYLIVMGVTGLVIPLFHTPATVLLQEKVEESFLGRVFGLFGMITSAVMPLGMLVFGPLSDTVAIEWLLVGTGILMLAVSALLLGSKSLVKAGLASEGQLRP
jgi:DHA3 family macrolide efflux protein-like MFS transporter